MSILLKLKHWQIFGLLVGIPFIFQFVFTTVLMFSQDYGLILIIFPIMMVLVLAVFLSWFYALGTNLYEKLPAGVKMNVTLFKIFIFIPVAYIVFVSLFMVEQFNNFSGGGKPVLASFAIIVPLHLFSMFCIFYCLYFNAKSFKAVELQRPVTFGDYAGEFFLIWFFPISIWIIQPRINQLFKDL